MSDRPVQTSPPATAACTISALALGAVFYLYFTSIVGANLDPFSIGAFLGDPAILDATNAWRPRVFSVFLSQRYLRFLGSSSFDGVVHAIAGWNTAWLTASFLVLLWGRVRPWVLVGLAASVLYAYVPSARIYFYPWDYPALFFYSVAAVCFLEDRKVGLVAAVLLGTGFKETLVVASLLLLGIGDDSLRKRAILCAGVFATGLSIKVALNALTGSGFFFVFDTVDFSNRTWIPLSNLWTLLDLRLDHVIFVNAGTLLISLLVPAKDARGWTCRGVIILFTTGNLFLGIIAEYRIFLEIAPISLLAIGRPWDQQGAPSTSGPEPRSG